MGKKIILGLAVLLIVSYSEMLREKTYADDSLQRNTAIEVPADPAVSEAVKIWEGEIKERKVAFFRTKKEEKIEEILVVTQDMLPHEFRRFEYFDKDGDGELNIVMIKTYREGEGWENAEINENNKYALAFANGKYKEYLSRIKEKMAKQAGK